MNASVIAALVVVVILVALVAVPQYLTRRAIRSLIRIFRQQGAVTPVDAKTIDELGLTPRTFIERLYKLRDYKPYALEIMTDANVIQATEDGRLYLSEEHLATSRWSEYKSTQA